MRQIKYEDKLEMVLDCVGGHDEIMVIELNAQCIALDKYTRRFISTFPKSWDKFVKMCINSDFNVGGVTMCQEDGVNIAILNNIYYRVGKNKDSTETVKQMTVESIKKLVKTVGKDKHFISGYIGDGISKRVWSSAVDYISKENLNWSVYRE